MHSKIIVLSLLSPLLVLICPLSAEQDLLNLPLPESGLRYENAEMLKPKWPAQHGEGLICLWGDDRMSALSITIDDNNAPDIPFWQEMSEETGWKFTWFVIVHPMMWDIYEDKPGNNTSYFGSAELFRELAEEGHEIGLHGSCKFTNELDKDAYREHVLKSKAHLEAGVGKRVVTYAYPCGATGKEGLPDIYRQVIGETMIGARGTAGGPTPVHSADILNTKSMGAVGFGSEQSTRRRLNMLEDPERPFKYSYYRGWPVLLYHGLGSDAKKQKVREAFDMIKAEEEKYWIRPFGTVAAYLQERASGEIEVRSVEPNRIVFDLRDRMQDEIYDVPLTVKFRVDGWGNTAAKQGDTLVNARIVKHEGASYALVDAVPDRGAVILIRR